MRILEFMRWQAITTGGLLVWLSSGAYAVEGATEINHTTALAGGVTVFDTPGYPVTLGAPGNYVLTGPLAPIGVAAIDVTVDFVRIDLGGFLVSCTGGAGVHGISASGRESLQVSNGTIRSCGGAGIIAGDGARIESVVVTNHGQGGVWPGVVLGRFCLVEDTTARGNTGDGIQTGDYCTVTRSVASQNGGAGIHTGFGSTVSGNTTSSNTGRGIFVATGSTVADNTVMANGGDGITADPGCVIRNNSTYGNGGDGIEVGSSSSIVGNSMTSNARCGLNHTGTGAGGRSGFAHNVINSNNGANNNRQVNAAALVEMSTGTATDNRDTNVCSGLGLTNDNCGAVVAPANNCP